MDDNDILQYFVISQKEEWEDQKQQKKIKKKNCFVDGAMFTWTKKQKLKNFVICLMS